MSWFEEQLKSREKFDNENFEQAFKNIADAIMGKNLSRFANDSKSAKNAIDEILKYYHIKNANKATPGYIKKVEDMIDYHMKSHAIAHRSVELSKRWYKNASGPMLGRFIEDGTNVAFIPKKLFGYKYFDYKKDKWCSLNKKNENLFDKEAVCFYKPLPQKALTVKDLVKFIFAQLSIFDYILYFCLLGFSTALGLLAPYFSKHLFSNVIRSSSYTVLASMAIFMICYSISRSCFQIFQSLIKARMGTKQSIAVEAAVMMRIMDLPPSYFRNHAAGELSQRADHIKSLCSTIFNIIGESGFTSVFSLVYIIQIFAYTPALVIPSLTVTVLTLIISIFLTLGQIKSTKEKMEILAKSSGLTYSTITGIQKIKLSGAEKRMFSRWADLYSQSASIEYNPPLFVKVGSTLSLTISLMGTLVMYVIAVKKNIDVSDYYAFNTAFAAISGAFSSVSSVTTFASNIKPTLDMARPLLEIEPETKDDKKILESIAGNIELNHVCFKYKDSTKNVIDDMSIKIKAGEYVAVVGTTGCGKSTLVRLLLGFEKPQRGAIFYDNNDLNQIELSSLRKKIGTVMQDDKLFLGDIYSNIVISDPSLNLSDAWKAAKIASIDEDIKKMPMGMNTLISEGQGGISGGQRQRLMIARAVAVNPKILIFDEATSALDNITQKKITQAIDKLNCTRIVIAHRLSTIKNADRIVYLEEGRIVEEGRYDELIKSKGKFAKLVERQLLEE